MSDVQIQAGMDWMETTLEQLAQNQGSLIRTLGWVTDPLDTQSSQHGFVLSLNGQQEILKVDDDALEDLPDDLNLQVQVEGALRALLNDRLWGSPLAV